MKVTKIKNRVLKESVNQLLEGTGNFYYENVCLLVTDEDYETGNYPAYEDRPINGNNNFPQYPLEDWNDDLCFWQIVMTPGYYEHACIDYVEVDCDDIYNDILYDAEHNIDNYAFEDGKWTYEDVFMRHRGEDPEEHSEEDVIKAIREWVFSDYPIITDEDIKQALERYKKDGHYAPSVFLCDSLIINKIEQQVRDKEAEICEQRINEIAKEYGFRKLGVTARFSSGETWYDYIDESLNEDENTPKDKDNTDSDFVIKNGTLKRYNGNESNVVIPDGVTIIGDGAFSRCTSLTSIEIPNSVTSIGYYAFSYCDKLTSIAIPNNVTLIGQCAFYDCKGLKSIVIPNSVKRINDEAFYNCTALEEINFNATSCAGLDYDNYVFAYAGQNGKGITVTFGDNVNYIPSRLFYPYYNSSYAPKIISVNIGNSVTKIGDGAFHECTSLKSIVIPNSVESIGGYVFDGCDSLASIEIPDNIKIGFSAFGGCDSLTSITYKGTKEDALTKLEVIKDWGKAPSIEKVICTDGVINLKLGESLQKDGRVLKEGSQEKVYAQALKTGQPLNNTELSALISDKVDEWIAAGRITANTSFNDVEKMFRDEISKSANDIFVVKTFDIIKKRYLDGIKG